MIHQLLATGASEIVLDLDDLQFVDGAGARAIRQVVAETWDIGGRCTLLDPGPQVRRVLDLVGVAGRVAFQRDCLPQPTDDPLRPN